MRSCRHPVSPLSIECLAGCSCIACLLLGCSLDLRLARVLAILGVGLWLVGTVGGIAGAAVLSVGGVLAIAFATIVVSHSRVSIVK